MTPVKRGPHMEDCPGMGELTQTPADQVTYGGWTPSSASALAIGCPAGISALGSGIALPNPSLADILAENMMEIVSVTELAALRADRERLDELIGFLNHYYLFAVYVKLKRLAATTPMTATGEEWREVIDAARSANPANPAQATTGTAREDVQK